VVVGGGNDFFAVFFGDYASRIPNIDEHQLVVLFFSDREFTNHQQDQRTTTTGVHIEIFLRALQKILVYLGKAPFDDFLKPFGAILGQ
jgi:hypothetical protein